MATGFDPQPKSDSPPIGTAVQHQSAYPTLDTTILKHFADLEDPRVERTKDHLLIDIVAIAILAVVSGADGWVAIETYGKSKQEWLKQFLALPNGIPSHDTFSRVFARLDPHQLHQCFLNWIESITQALGAQVIAIDGKTLKQSYDPSGSPVPWARETSCKDWTHRDRKLKALHVVSAWANDHRLVLGQVKVERKSNEITAIPSLLEMLEIAGCIITIDAMGCQKGIAAEIIKQKADYVTR